MLFDPEFVNAVYADPMTALHDTGLSPAQVDWLRQPDRRAFGADPHFGGRRLYGLAMEYPATVAVLQRAGTDLMRFFFSPNLHCAYARVTAWR